jgi:transcriptional regulator with XRE-family HTH domain
MWIRPWPNFFIINNATHGIVMRWEMNMILKISILQKFGRQADFAQATGLGETLLSKIVCGRRSPTDEQKSIIAQKLGVPAGELFPCQN